MPLRPDGSSLYVNAPLTNISIAYQQNPQDYVAARVFQPVGVQRQGDLYWKYNKGDWFRSEAALRAPATESAGGGWEVSTDSFFTNVYAVHKDIDDQARANATGAFQLDRDATLWVTRDLLLKRDQQFVSNYFTGSVWTGSDTGNDKAGVASSPTGDQFLQWNDASSTPIENIRKQVTAMQEKTGYRPNVLLMGPYVFDALIDHPDIIDRVKYGQTPGAPAMANEQVLAQMFGVDRVVVARTIQNTGNVGGTDSFSFVAGKAAALYYANPTPSLLQPSAGYIFTWDGLLGGGALGTRIKRFRMEEKAADRVEGEMAWDMKVVANDLGVYFGAAVA